jgi:hypothetical protein
MFPQDLFHRLSKLFGIPTLIFTEIVSQWFTFADSLLGERQPTIPPRIFRQVLLLQNCVLNQAQKSLTHNL